MRVRWPHIRFTLFEFVLAPQESAEGIEDVVWGHGTGGSFELAQEPSEADYDEEERFGFH